MVPIEHRIWLDDREYLYAVVDEEDYHWAAQWKWYAKPSRSPWKFYACRQTKIRDDCGWRNVSLYLHVEIQKRSGVVQPHPTYKLSDHRDGDSLNCRRGNLRWATPSMNRRNIRGQCPKELLE